MYQSDVKLLQQLISDDYRVHMQLDNLPVAIHGDRCVVCGVWCNSSASVHSFLLLVP